MNPKITDKVCNVGDLCNKYLFDFGIDIPERCKLCTPMVKYTLTCIANLGKDPFTPSEEDVWNG